MHQRPGRSTELLLLLLLATLWGASYSFIRVAVETLPPLALMAARTAIAAVLLVAFMRWRGLQLPRDRARWRQFAVQAVLNSVLPFTLLAWAQQEVEAGLAAILNSCAPLFVFLGTWAITRHERVTWPKLLGVVVGLAGTGLVIGTEALRGAGDRLLPQLAIVLATVCYAGAAIYGRHFQGLHPAAPAAGSLLCGAIVLVPISLVVDRPWTLVPSGASLLALLGLAVFSTSLALVIYFRLVATLGSVATTAQAYLRVPIGVGIGVLFLGESMAPTAWLGMLCVMVGVAAMSMRTRPVRPR
ncbi:MAG TPA: EamA family transporter [Ramlibacter sp.]|nr:EamA family transporter [Ramlibacter sp.]